MGHLIFASFSPSSSISLNISIVLVLLCSQIIWMVEVWKFSLILPFFISILGRILYHPIQRFLRHLLFISRIHSTLFSMSQFCCLLASDFPLSLLVTLMAFISSIVSFDSPFLVPFSLSFLIPFYVVRMPQLCCPLRFNNSYHFWRLWEDGARLFSSISFLYLCWHYWFLLSTSSPSCFIFPSH